MPSRTQVLALRRSWLVHYPQQPQLIEGALLSHTLPGGGTCNTWLKDGSGAVDAAIRDQHVSSEQLLCWCLLLPKGRLLTVTAGSLLWTRLTAATECGVE